MSTSVQVPADKPVGTEYKVQLTKKDDSVLSSDTAEIVVRPRDVKIAVILAEPLDDSHNATIHNKNYYLSNIIPDLQEYYKEVSYGAVNIVINAADVYDDNGNWYKLANTAAYYGKNITKIDANGTTYEDGLDNSYKFASHAVGVSKVIANNYDVVVVVHAKDSWQQHPDNWDLMRTEISGDKYVLVSESELMGTWAHEIGHWMGKIFQPNKPPYILPDVYALSAWDLMGSGNWLGNMRNPDHMSSYSKEWVGWLKYKSLYYPNTGTYWINSITTMKYGDNIIRYILKENLDPRKVYRNYYIIETRTNNPDYSKWDTSAPIPKGYSNALVLYQVEEIGIGNTTVNFIDNLTIGSGSHSSYWDSASLLRFSAIGQRARTEGTRSIFEMNVEIAKFDSSNKVGAIATPSGSLLGYVPNSPSLPYDREIILPDFDLHAYTPDGKHIGVNYTTKVYENEIRGANASGDLLNGMEWIFVPDNVKVQFFVDGRDNQEFLDVYSGLREITNGSQPYNLSIVYDSPESIRYSTSVEQSILPGEVMKYNYSIAKIDGTYKVVIDGAPPDIFNTTPENVTKNLQISAEFSDNLDGSGIDGSSISLTIDGIDLTRNAVLTGSSINIKPTLNDGVHEVALTIGDKAGNKATANWNFTLDTAPPEITISNISALTNQTILPIITAVDARDTKPIISVSLDGATYNGSPIEAAGEHLLTVTASDDLGNIATQTLNFIIDKTKPSIDISGVSDGSYYNLNATPAIAVVDANLDTQSITLNGAPFTSETVVSAEGSYALVASGTDKAGNSDSKSVNFVIDRTKPGISISRVSDGSYYNLDVTPVITITDSNLDTQSITLNGAPFTSGTVISAEGGYALIASGTDKAGNSDSTTVNFVVDKTKPGIDINGVSDGSYYNLNVTPAIAVMDANLDTQSITLNGAPFTSETVVSAEGSYALIASGTDKAGNSDSKTLNFVIDKTKPSISISGVSDGSYYNIDVTPVITITDSNLYTQSITLNGAPFVSDTVVSAEGSYALIASATDKAGNNDSSTVNFVVDKTKPSIDINGVNDGSYYNLDVTPVIAITDANLDIQSITLNGVPFTSSTVVSAEDSYALVASGTDKAGNSDSKTVNFVVDKTKPSIDISGVSDGSYYSTDVTPVITITDSNIDTQSITLKDAPFVSGTVISAEGSYSLVALATDKAGNSDSKTVNFVVDKTPPSVSITGAENDGFYNISKTISYVVTDDIDASPLISANYESGTVFSDETDYSVQISAKDHAGNIAIKILNFSIDKTPPVVNIISPTNDSYVAHIVKITGTATDLHMKTISLEADGNSVANATEYLWGSTKVADGEHEIKLNAEDKAGNTASTSIKVKIDNTPPDIFNIIPQDNTVVNATYSISADYSDTGSGIDVNSFSILIDGIDETRNAVVTNTSMQYKPYIQDGKHVLKLSVNDTVGNSRTVATSFEKDTTPPEVKINFPSNDSFVRQTIIVSGNAYDLHLDNISLEIDGIKVSSSSTYTWDTVTAKDRTYEIKLSATDIVKNSASTSINVTVDNTPPVIQFNPANGTEFYSDQNLTIDYNATDATSGVASSSVALDGIVVSKGDLIDLRNLSIGSHTIQVNANDNAGNSAESSTTFIVKPLPAIVEIEPHTLNINSSGRWIQAKIEIPGYNANQIDILSIRLNGTVLVEIKTNDGSELKVKFNRTQVQSIISLGDVTLYISGKVNGAAFLGNTTIRVIENQKIDFDKENEKLEKNDKNKGGKS